MAAALWLMGLLLLLGFSVAVRMLLIARRQAAAPVVDPKPSPLSQAVQQLVEAAGGIYLALIMLVSFLQLDVPEKVFLLGVGIDPLALFSLVVASLQPLVAAFTGGMMSH